MTVSRNNTSLAVDCKVLPRLTLPTSAKSEVKSGVAISEHCSIYAKVHLAKLTSFRVGGCAEWFVTPRTVQDLRLSLAWAESEKIPVTFLGAGSNLLVSDRGIPGLTIAAKELRHLSFDDTTGQVTAAAGEPIPRLAWKLAKRGWQGLEWAVGIPGTVGGAVVMNAGAHQSCIANSLVSIEILNDQGEVETLTREQLQFSYRSSLLQHQPRLVLRATFQLEPEHDPAVVKATTTHHLHHRHSTQPYNRPSCGSVFRNPQEKAAGWLIERTGLKGFQLGGAQVSEQHANFILNCGHATANDIFRLIHHVRETVHDQWSVLLHPEVKTIGEFPALL